MSTEKAHALLSPSGANKWLTCTASLAMESRCEDAEEDSVYAQEGTAAHELAEVVLEARIAGDKDANCEQYVGLQASNGWTITEDMVDNIQEYVDTILNMAEGNQLIVEGKVDFSEYSGVSDESFGTSDVVIIADGGISLQIHDLKYGMKVVSAEGNYQLMLYALGVYSIYSVAYDIKRIQLFIHQQRQGIISEHSITTEELLDFGELVKEKATEVMYCLELEEKGETLPGDSFNPSASACQYCRAKAYCKPLADFTFTTIGDSFKDIETDDDIAAAAEIVEDLPAIVDQEDSSYLGRYMDATDLIELWCRAIRGQVERKLFQGKPVTGYKLVEGRKGNRSWLDTSTAERILKGARIPHDSMYTKKLITAPQAAKLLEGKKPKVWAKVEKLITQAPGKPSVAPQSDKRPAITVGATEDDFTDIL
jgi:hypothetical protein